MYSVNRKPQTPTVSVKIGLKKLNIINSKSELVQKKNHYIKNGFGIKNKNQ